MSDPFVFWSAIYLSVGFALAVFHRIFRGGPTTPLNYLLVSVFWLPILLVYLIMELAYFITEVEI